ncbi:hypothetical protein JCM6882_006938 [Rhodosporidiobolus microsporus]
MPSSSSTDTAYATAPPSPSAGEKDDSLAAVAAEQAAPPTASPSTTPFEPPLPSSPSADRTATPSASLKRKADVFYGPQQYSDLSSLSSSSGEEDDPADGDVEGEDLQNSDEELEVKTESGKRRYSTDARTWSATAMWTRSMNLALERGIRLIPSLSTNKVSLNGARVGRNGVLAEYLRRQTGQALSGEQVHSRLQQLRQKALPDLKVLLKGEDKILDDIFSMD